MLGVVAMLAAVDRNILSVLLVPIQNDLRVSDAAMGALTGTAMALVYATVALPMGRLADRINRRNLLAVAVAAWSVATAACAAASGFLHLFLARLAVGAAEAAQPPATMSMIGDLYPAVRRGAAISVVIVGSTIGYSLGSFVAGVLNDHYGWRGAMMAVGLPGLVVALLVRFTVPEPVRGVQDGGQGGLPRGTLVEQLRQCARIRTFYPLALGLICMTMAFTGWLAWAPAFLMRVHHLSATRMSALFGLVVGGAALANMIAGVLSDRLARRGARWRLYYCCAVIVLVAPALAASSLVESLNASIACLLFYTLVSGGLTTVTTATYVSLAPSTTRAFVTALMLFCSLVLGAGAGPLLFGLLNDAISRTQGDEALRYSLLLGPALLAAAGVFYLFASRTVDVDTAAAAARGDATAAS
jgi:predicted MFS family arabinose efflux permease